MPKRSPKTSPETSPQAPATPEASAEIPAPVRNPRGAGRKPKYSDMGAMVESSVRMPAAMWNHLEKNGGVDHLRTLIARDMERVAKWESEP